MTYGLSVENSLGKLVFSDQRMVPYFRVKATFVSAASSFAGFNLSYTVSGLTAGSYLAMCTLPDNGSSDVWYALWPCLMNIDASGAATITVRVKVTPGVSYIQPEVYVFSLNHKPSSTSAWGLALYDNQGRLTFDIGSRPMAIASMPVVPMSTQSNTYLGVSISNMPTKPLFSLYDYLRIQDTLNGGGGIPTSTLHFYACFLKRTGSTLYAKEFEYDILTHQGSSSYNATYVGSGQSQPVPVLNAAIYD